MTNKYAETHWSIKVLIGALIALSVAQGYLLNQNMTHTKATACMSTVLVMSEYGNNQFTADQDYGEWRQGVLDEIAECLEDYE